MMNDIVHKKGFPEGWHVQERDAEEALLCVEGVNFLSCVCRKPRLTKIDDWLPTARKIAEALK